MENYLSRIEIVPGKRSGKPCIKGSRITVYDILGYLAGGTSYTELLEDFPQLTIEDIKASLAFMANKQNRIYQSYDNQNPA